MAKQLQQKADEAQQHKESLANTEELLQHQQQLMSSQLRQKHEELSAAHGQNKQLQVCITGEEVYLGRGNKDTVCSPQTGDVRLKGLQKCMNTTIRDLNSAELAACSH